MATTGRTEAPDSYNLNPIDSVPKVYSAKKISVKSPDELRDFFNNGGIEELATPLDYLLSISDSDIEDARVCIREEDYEVTRKQFSAYWHHQMHRNESRLLVIQSSLSNLAGLYLSVPVQLDSYHTIRGGSISASYSPRLPHGKHRVGHYLKNGEAPHIGNPAVAVRVQRIATRQLLNACQLVEVEESYWAGMSETDSV